MTTVGLNQHLYDLHKQLDIVQSLVETVSGGAEDVLAERAEITQILTTFYRAPLSMSSVQPLLDLAERLNPALKNERHQAAVTDLIVKRDVRETCVLRDGKCRRNYFAPWQGWSHINDVKTPLHEGCAGDSEWAHMHARRRSKTLGMPPEIRHDTRYTLILCTFHHQEYDAKRLIITALSRKGADGPLKFRRAQS